MDLWNREMLFRSEQVPRVNHVGSRCYLCSLDSGSPSFSSFLLEKLLLNNSVNLLSVPRPGPNRADAGGASACPFVLREREGAPRCAGSTPALLGLGQAEFPAGILAAFLSFRHFT